jgi:hypothetical protein
MVNIANVFNADKYERPGEYSPQGKLHKGPAKIGKTYSITDYSGGSKINPKRSNHPLHGLIEGKDYEVKRPQGGKKDSGHYKALSKKAADKWTGDDWNVMHIVTADQDVSHLYK